MTERPVGFLVNGVAYRVPIDAAAALADRLHNASAGNVSSAFYTAAVMTDRMIEGEGATSPEWYVPEKDALRKVLEDWLIEETVVGFPASLMDLRYGLFAEAQDELPGGLYHFILDLGNAERDAIRELDRPPVPGQPFADSGQTFIVKTITPAPGSEFVAIVAAERHPG